MIRTKRILAAALAAVTMVVALSGCGITRTTPNGTENATEMPTDYAVVPIGRSEAPQELQAWAETPAAADGPAFKTVTQDGVTYLAAMGGQQTSGGFTVRVKDYKKVDGKLAVALEVVPPTPGSLATMQLTHPVGFFKITPTTEVEPTLFDVNVISEAASARPDEPHPFTMAVTLVAGEHLSLLIHGRTSLPDVHIETRSQAGALKQADVQVKDGQFSVALTAPGMGVDAAIVATDPVSGKELGRIPMPTDRMADTTWGENFGKVLVLRLDDKQVTVQGEARVFEGQFVMEIRAGYQVLATVPMQASKGAPEWGSFEKTITINSAPLPERGAEAWFYTRSAKDGSLKLELIAPVLSGTGK